MRQYKSRKMRRVWKRTSKGKAKIIYRKRKPGKIICGVCKSKLHGIPRLIKSKFRHLSKSSKRPTRPYGGYLCSKCTREKIKEKALEKWSK